MDETAIKTGEMAVGKNNTVIKTGSVGSCVVVALYDDEAKVGGLAHSMLPARREGSEDDSDAQAKYADEAVDNLVVEIEKNGGDKSKLVAKLVGGGAMFKNSSSHIGDDNVASAKSKLTELGIHVENEDTGGSMGKSVELNLSTGLVKVETSL